MKNNTDEYILNEFFEYIDTSRSVGHFNNVKSAIKELSWIFLNRWEKFKLIFSIIRQIIKE